MRCTHSGRFVGEPLPDRLSDLWLRMRRTVGIHRMARMLGVSVATIHALDYGGTAKPETVTKIVAALEALSL